VTNIDKRIYAGTALGAALAGGGLLLATQPIGVDVIHAANAATHANVSAWKGIPGIVLHDDRGVTSPRTAEK
jgi:hypothetical protein